MGWVMSVSCKRLWLGPVLFMGLSCVPENSFWKLLSSYWPGFLPGSVALSSLIHGALCNHASPLSQTYTTELCTIDQMWSSYDSSTLKLLKYLGWHWEIRQVVPNIVGWIADLKTASFFEQEIKVLLHFAFPWRHRGNDRVSLLIHEQMNSFGCYVYFPKVFFFFPRLSQVPRSELMSALPSASCLS